MQQNVPPFAELLSSCKHSAFHLEMHDSYTDPSEAEELAAWRNGFRYDPEDRDSWWRPFLDTIAEAVGRGVVIRRTRIVAEPVSDYIKFEHSGTFTNIAAGEEIRWLPRRRTSDIALPGNDCWIFDGRLVRFGYFSGDGTFLDHELADDPAVVKLCADAFETAWDRAIPHEEYRID